jgi:hypothetical protein
MPRSDAVGEWFSAYPFERDTYAARRAAKGERLVFTNGISSSQAPTRIKLIAMAVRAAQEMTATGAVPTYYEPLATFGFALFYVSAVVGFLALAAYGGSLLQVGLFCLRGPGGRLCSSASLC